MPLRETLRDNWASVPLVRAARTARLLVASLRGEAWPDVPDAPDAPAASLASHLVDAARFHGIAGYVYRWLDPGAWPDATRRDLDLLRMGALETHLRAVADLAWIRQELERAGIPWIVVKGPVLAATAHERPDLRAYSDLDLVVTADAYPDALRVLERAGAAVAADNWWHRAERVSGEVPLILPSGLVLDLHWHLLNDKRLRRAFTVSMPSLFANVRHVDVNGISIPTLDLPDTLAYVALHTTLSGGDRLVWIKDIERLATSADLDWGVLGERARRWNTTLVCALALEKAHDVLGFDIPVHAIDSLGASKGWRVAGAVARRLAPPARSIGRPSLDRIVSRATRSDLRTSSRELLERSLRWGGVSRSRPEALAPDDRARRDGGRRAYLAAVANAGRQPSRG